MNQLDSARWARLQGALHSPEGLLSYVPSSSNLEFDVPSPVAVRVTVVRKTQLRAWGHHSQCTLQAPGDFH